MTSLAVFRCDAGPAIGGGHVMRCLTLADALAARGWTCRFAVGPMTADLVPDVVRYAPISVPDSPDREAGTIAASIGACDLLIVDHYGRDAVFEKASRSFARSILTIDDLADRAHDCDILVDQTLGRREADYRSIVPERCRLLLGTAYALLRPQFCAAREHALGRRHESEPARRVLISFGASNSNGLAATAISSLCAPGSALMLDVVTGAHVPLEVSALAERFPERVVVHGLVDDMASLMAEADIAVGAGGTTSWERCAVGLPSIIVVTADNQRTVAAELVRAGGAELLGDWTTVSAQQIAGAVAALAGDALRRLAMSEAAAAICDGRGTDRVIEAIIGTAGSRAGANAPELRSAS